MKTSAQEFLVAGSPRDCMLQVPPDYCQLSSAVADETGFGESLLSSLATTAVVLLLIGSLQSPVVQCVLIVTATLSLTPME